MVVQQDLIWKTSSASSDKLLKCNVALMQSIPSLIELSCRTALQFISCICASRDALLAVICICILDH